LRLHQCLLAIHHTGTGSLPEPFDDGGVDFGRVGRSLVIQIGGYELEQRGGRGCAA
jgi:hypothetical protein